MTRASFTPPELADRWAVTPDKVLQLIRAGELAAVNLALRTGPGCRPRWRIALAAVEAFERRRAASPVVKPQRRQTAKPDGFVEYF